MTKPSGPTRILIADDQDDVRSGFRLILGSQPDMTVVGEAADGLTAVRLARTLNPDVVLADIRMPGLDGLELTRLLTGPGVPDPMRVLVVTTFDHDDYVRTALRDGACGFLLKDGSPALLTEAVRAVAAGNSLISPAITVRLLRHMAAAPGEHRPTAGPESADRAPAERPARRGSDLPPADPLTERELEVVRLVARGRTNEEVAAGLYVTLSTVKTHLGSVQRKLATRNRVEIAAWAWENGLCAAE